MNRRTFLENSALLGAATALPFPHLPQSGKPKYKMGLQLFSLNDDMNEDPIGTLKAVKELGYEDFEIYGFDPNTLSYYGINATAFKTILDDMGLSVSSGHYGFSVYLNKSKAKLQRFVDQCIEGAQALDAAYITWPWIAPRQRNFDTLKKMVDRLNLIGEQITAAGLGFAYHNHGFEFADYSGQNGYDLILAETDPDLVKLQLDMYWVMHSSKRTPKELIDLQPGRYVMWHIKDMDKVTRDYTELGNGSIDYTQILPDLSKSGLEYYYIEQGGNFTQSALRSAADSAEYFKKNLQKYL